MPKLDNVDKYSPILGGKGFAHTLTGVAFLDRSGSRKIYSHFRV